MQLTIFNGSPKRGANNTGVLLNRFVEGVKTGSKYECETYKLSELTNLNEAVYLFEKSEYILLAFPLYVYSMPSGVIKFIELLEPLIGKCKGKKIGFLVQYGFPEAVHARPLEKYLEKLAEMLGCENFGTIIKGGCDALTKTSETQSQEILNGIYVIGKQFGATGTLDKTLLDEYSKPETQTLQPEEVIKRNIEYVNENYWSAQLKKNGAYDKSYARPYVIVD